MARVLVAALVAMIIAILSGPTFIAFLRKNEFGQHVREDGPERHLEKQGTPTMGGLLILLAASIAFLPLSDYTLPALTIFANAIAIFGAAVYSASALNVTPAAYILQTLSLLAPGDIWQGLAKSVVFAVLITLIGVSTGFSVSGGAEGVGRATTRSVVLAICYIIVADMIFSFFLNR